MAIQTFVSGQVLTAAQVTAVQNNQYNQTVSTKTASYVLVAADVGTRVVMNSASATTITVNTSLFSAGDTLRIHNIGAGACTITAGTATVNSSTGLLVLSQYDSGELYFTSAAVAIFFPSHQASFGFGIVSATSVTAASGNFTAETLRITSPSFTAVANRYYRISYIEPVLQFATGTVNNIGMLIRITNISGAIQNFSEIKIASANNNAGSVQIVKTLTAGATVFVGTVIANGGGQANAYGAANCIAQLIIEDIGPA